MSSGATVSLPQSCCPSSQSADGVVPGMVIGAVVVAPNVVIGSVEAMGVVGGAVVAISAKETEKRRFHNKKYVYYR